jgi:recyclin-1
MEVLQPTRNTPSQSTKMSLPIELLQEIVEFMPVQTQLRFARTSHAMRDMIYDDARWVAKLKAMCAWNEEDARRGAEEEIARRRLLQQRAAEEAVLGRPVINGHHTTTLFDATLEAKNVSAQPVMPIKTGGDLLDFDSFEAFGDFQSVEPPSPQIRVQKDKAIDSATALTILSSVVSRRGQARQQFGRVYKTLAPLYVSLANSSIEDSTGFKHLRTPEEQAKLLKVLELFGRSRAVDDWTKCQKRIAWIMETFERKALTEFEEYPLSSQAHNRAYDAQDIDGKMKRYAYILTDLNGGESCINSFIHKHPSIFSRREDPMICLTYILIYHANSGLWD